MNTLPTAYLALLGAAILPLQAQTQPIRDYRCTIERVAVAGTHENKTEASLQQNDLGKQFTVERRTGLMAGALKNSYATRPQVIDLGSEHSSYKVVTTVRREEGVGFTDVQVLVVTEWDKSPQFVFLSNYVVYLGTCVHF